MRIRVFAPFGTLVRSTAEQPAFAAHLYGLDPCCALAVSLLLAPSYSPFAHSYLDWLNGAAEAVPIQSMILSNLKTSRIRRRELD